MQRCFCSGVCQDSNILEIDWDFLGDVYCITSVASDSQSEREDFIFDNLYDLSENSVEFNYAKK